MDDLAILRDLVEAPSPSGDEDEACAVFVDHAARLGLSADRDAAGNAIAHVGTGRPHLMVLGHVDTVPGVWPVRIRDGAVSGRGAVDAKGALAAALAAVARIGDRVRGTRTVVAAVGEETDSRGAFHLLRGPMPDALIVGEPSGWDRVAIGFRGRRIGSFATTSVPGHPSSPEPGALDRAVEAAARVRAYIAERATGSPFTSPSCRVRDWEYRADPDRESAAFEIDVRCPPAFEWDGLASAAPEIRWSRAVEAVRVDKGNAAVRALVGAIRGAGGRPSYVLKGGTSDMNHARRVWRIPMASYGPGDPRLDHTPFERLPIPEFLRSIDVLERAIGDLAGRLDRAVRDEGRASLAEAPTGRWPSTGKGSGTSTRR